MNVYFEGPNCSGKSTIADLVKNALRWDQLNLHHRKGDQFTRYLSEYGRTDTVFVRAHWSEFVYSDLFGRADPFRAEEMACLNQAARLRGIVVLCLPQTVDVLVQRFEQRQLAGIDTDKQAKLELIEREYKLWDAHFSTFGDGPGGPLDYTYRSNGQEDLKQSVELIVRMVREREPANW